MDFLFAGLIRAFDMLIHKTQQGLHYFSNLGTIASWKVLWQVNHVVRMRRQSQRRDRTLETTMTKSMTLSLGGLGFEFWLGYLLCDLGPHLTSLDFNFIFFKL